MDPSIYRYDVQNVTERVGCVCDEYRTFIVMFGLVIGINQRSETRTLRIFEFTTDTGKPSIHCISEVAQIRQSTAALQGDNLTDPWAFEKLCHKIEDAGFAKLRYANLS
jgi:hypothetical protein